MRKLLLFLAVSIIATSIYSQRSISFAYTPVQKRNIGAILNADGSLRSQNGSFSTEGYKISYKQNGEPVFLPEDIATAVGDENWASEFTQPGVTGVVFTVFVDGADVYIGGNFTRAGSTAVTNIAKWSNNIWSNLGVGIGGQFDAVTCIRKYNNQIYAAHTAGVSCWNGTNWTTIGTISEQVFNNLLVSAIGFDAAGNLYAGGSFKKIDGVSVNCIAKWNGTSWSALGSGLSGPNDQGVNSITTVGNELYIAGGFYTAGGVPSVGIAKWNGSAWVSVGGITGTGGITSLVTVGSDVYAFGDHLSSIGGVPILNAGKWNGTSWSQLGSGLNDGTYSAAVAGNEIIVSGYFSQSGSTPLNRIAKWTGSNWVDMGNGMVLDQPWAIGASTQEVFVGGNSSDLNPAIDMTGVARWSGTKWEPVGKGANDNVNCITIDGNNLYIGGKFTRVGGLRVNRIAKWDGIKWDSLGAGFGFGEVYDIAIMGGKVYACGTFQGGPHPDYIASWDGTSWSALGLGTSYRVYALATNGTELFVGGEFATAGGLTCNGVAKWNGTAWSTMGGPVLGNISDMQVGPDGTVYACGQFTQIGLGVAKNIAKWNGTVWQPIGQGANALIKTMVISPTNEIYIGGNFDVAGTVLANRVAKWNGTAWGPLGSGVTIGGIMAMALRGNDLFVSGSFTSIGGTSANNIAKWNGSSWSALGSGTTATGTLLPWPVALAVNCNSLYVGGFFNQAGEKGAMAFSRYAIDGLPGVAISTPSTTICNGTNAVFTATPANGGTDPVYQWRLNGSVVGSNSPSYSSSTLHTNDQVMVTMTGSSSCIAPINATSNIITMTVNPNVTPSATISGTTTVNQGTPTLITAAPVNGGASPIYQWEDSTNLHTWQTIAGATSATINYTPGLTGDKLRSKLTSNANCATPTTVTSNALAFIVNIVTAVNPSPANKFGIKFYPNPVRKTIFIDSLKISDQWQTAEIVTIDGRKLDVGQKISNRIRATIDVEALPVGEYILVLRRTKGGPAYFKFIKQ